jgi:hypothetical protein
MRIILALVLTLMAGGPVAMATTLAKMSFIEVSRAADGVLIGTVADISSQRAHNGIIYSFVTLNDLEIVRGNYSGKQFTLRLEGGEVAGEIQRIEGAPQFREGERVMVFVDGNGQNMVPVAGWTQGLFRIVSGPDDEEKFIVDALGNRVFGIHEGEIIKESRYGSEAELVGGAAGAAGGLARSDTPRFDLGDVQGGRLLHPEESGVDPAVQFAGTIGEVVTLDAFRQQIATEIQAAGIGPPSGTLTSVEPGTLPPTSPADATPPSPAEGGDALTLLPADRGSTPRRIEPAAEGSDE